MENIATALEIRVWKTLKRYTDLMQGNAPVLVAVSGGPDSVAMLHILHSLINRHKLHAPLHVAHFDHSQRGESSKEDAEFVRSIAASLGLSFHLERLDDFHMLKGRGLEDNLRRARFRFFMNLTVQLGAQVIFVGHNYNDNIETVLMRLFRGSNIHGISGIKTRRTMTFDFEGRRSQLHVIRPILDVKRDEIIEFLDAQKIPYRLDPTNGDNKLRRNWVRNVLLKEIRANFNLGIDKVIHQFCEQMRSTESFINRCAAQAYPEIVSSREGKGLSLKVSVIKSRHPAIVTEVISRALTALKITGVNNYRHIKAIYRLAASDKTTAQLPLPDAFLAVREDDLLHLLPKKTWDAYLAKLAESKLDAATEFVIPVPGQTFIPGIGVIRTQILPFYDDFMATFVEQKTNLEEFADADKIVLPLVFRYPRKEDRFKPLGFNSDRKLSSFLRDARVPLYQRDKVPLIADSEKIIWVVKLRMSEAVKFEKGGITKKIVRISIKEI